MSPPVRFSRDVAALSAGLLFSLGLGFSGMTRPAKVLGFLDIAGDWDPSLALVMVGAIGVHALALRWILKRDRPLYDAAFHLPTQRTLDAPLVLGAAVFGVGWGLGGFCPGPAITSLVTLRPTAVLFVVAMVVGHALGAVLLQFLEPRAAADAAPEGRPTQELVG